MNKKSLSVLVMKTKKLKSRRRIIRLSGYSPGYSIRIDYKSIKILVRVYSTSKTQELRIVIPEHYSEEKK